MAVVEQARAGIREQITALDEGSPVALDRLRFYTGYWERCIKDQSAPFAWPPRWRRNCPPRLEEWRRPSGAISSISAWLERLMQLGAEQAGGLVILKVERRLSWRPHGAMLAAPGV